MPSCRVQQLFPGQVHKHPPSGSVTKLTDQRIAYACRQEAQGGGGETPKKMAARWGVTDRRIRQLLQRFRETRLVPKLNPRRRPPSPPLTDDQKRFIDEEWQRLRRGASKLYRALRKRGVAIPKMRIHTYLRQRGYTVPNPRKQKKRRRCRYEREHSGSLVHGDWHRTSEAHPECILWEDDASRFLLAGVEAPNGTAELSIECLDAAVGRAAEWGLPIRQVNTDQGSVFYAQQGESEFERHLEELGIEHVVSRVNNPQTNGKLERLWYEYDRHRWRFPTLEAFIEWYNDQIHDALWQELYETPREAFQRKLPQEVLLGLHLRLSTEEAGA